MGKEGNEGEVKNSPSSIKELLCCFSQHDLGASSGPATSQSHTEQSHEKEMVHSQYLSLSSEPFFALLEFCLLSEENFEVFAF